MYLTQLNKFAWLVILSLIILVAAYILNPDVAINIDRVLSMLSMADAKGLSMMYFSSGDWSYVVAAGVALLQSMLPFLSKSAVVAANVHFFGNTGGFLLTVLGFTVGALYAFVIGKAIGYLLLQKALANNSGLKGFIQKYGAYVVLIAYLIPAWPLGFVSYLAGFTMLKEKKLLFAAVIGGSIITIGYLFILIQTE